MIASATLSYLFMSTVQRKYAHVYVVGSLWKRPIIIRRQKQYRRAQKPKFRVIFQSVIFAGLDWFLRFTYILDPVKHLIELVTKIVNGYHTETSPLICFAEQISGLVSMIGVNYFCKKRFIINIWHGLKYTQEIMPNFSCSVYWDHKCSPKVLLFTWNMFLFMERSP